MNSVHMESIWKFHGIHLERPWNPSKKSMESIWKSMESINHSMESIHQNYGIHPPFHGIHPPFHGIHLEFLQSIPPSMDSTWNNPGRVKYWLNEVGCGGKVVVGRQKTTMWQHSQRCLSAFGMCREGWYMKCKFVGLIKPLWYNSLLWHLFSTLPSPGYSMWNPWNGGWNPWNGGWIPWNGGWIPYFWWMDSMEWWMDFMEW